MIEQARKWSLLLVMALLPFSQERVFLFDIPIYIPEIAILFALIFSLLTRRFFVALPAYITYAAAIIFFGVVTSLVFNGINETGLGILKSWFVFPMLYGYLFFCELKQNKWFQEKIFGVYFLIAVSAAFVAIALPIEGKWTFDGRLRGSFLSPNHLGLFLSPGFIIGIFFLMRTSIRKNPRGFLLFALGTLLVLITLLFSQSAGAVLSIVVPTGLLAIAYFTRSKRWIYLFSLFSVIALLSFFSYVGSRWVEYSQGEVRSSIASRVMIWNASASLIREHPILGIGPGNFQKEYLAVQDKFPPYLEWAVPHPHNIFLAFWLNTGLFGLCGFLFLSGYIVSMLFSLLMRLSTLEARLALGLPLALFIAFFVYGIADAPYFKNELAIFFWTFVAYAALLSNCSTSHRDKQSKTSLVS